MGYDKKTNKIYIKIDSKYFRPQEVDHLRGNFKKAKKILNWKPQINFKEMIKDMLLKDLKN